MPVEQLTDFINQTQTERLVLIIDQFEEVFTLCENDDERKRFFTTLLAVVEQADNKFCLVIVMQTDFLRKCSYYANLIKKIEINQIIVTPMTPTELEESIVVPTQLVGLQIEPKLVFEMLTDAKSTLGNLPFLQYTLKELWKACATQGLLTFSAYKALPIDQVIQKLVAANLIVINEFKEEQVTVVNNELIQHWGQLREWLNDNREAIIIQRNIEADAKKWKNNSKSKNTLLQGLDLNIAENYVKTHTKSEVN